MSKGTSLPARPHLDWYRKSAKMKLTELRARRPSAKLAAAQLAVAREQGFASWRKLVAAIASINTKGTAMFAAAEAGEVDALRRLLDENPNFVRVSDVSGLTPLHYAARAGFKPLKPGHIDVVALLLDRGADIEAIGENDNIGRCTPLHLACFSGADRTPIVRLLLRRGANPNVTNSRGTTPLFDAVWHEQREVAEVLLGAGVVPSIFEAVGLDQADVVQRMLQEDPQAIQRKHPYAKFTLWGFARSPRMRELLAATGSAPLIHEAAELGWTEEVRRQLDREPGLINARSEKGQTPLHHAIDWNRLETVALLLERGANPSSPWTPGPGWTPLQLAERRNKPQMIALLEAAQAVAAPADLSQVFDALMATIDRRDVATARTLVSQAPSVVNATGPHPRWGGRPQPIHVAIESDAMDIFQLLLDAGADPSGDSRSYDGWSPLMLAIHWKRDEMRDELLRRGAKVGLFEALMLGDDAIVRALLKSDPDVLNQPVPNGGTPLHFARTRRAVKLLLDAGVSPLAKDKYGRAPADVAVSKSIAHLLAKHGAEVTPQIMASLGDLAGLKNTISRNRAAVVDAEVLHRAVDAARIAVVRWLLDQGVDVNVRTVRGSKGTPLHSAAFTGNLAMVRLLLRRGADVAAIDGEHKTTPAVWARTALKMFNRQPCLEVAEYLENLKRS